MELSVLRILSIHNSYLQYGGEDSTFFNEVELLRQGGHEVDTINISNKEFSLRSIPIYFSGFLFSPFLYFECKNKLRSFKPDIVHFYNVFPQIGFSAPLAVFKEAPTIKTTQNFRSICAAGTLYRDGRICHDCFSHFLPAIKYRCYQGSSFFSAIVAGKIAFERLTKANDKLYSAHIAVSSLIRDSLIRGGVSPDKIYIRKNFVFGNTLETRKATTPFACFAGRLAAEKGIHTLLRVAATNKFQLIIIGDGPLRESVVSASGDSSNIIYKGWMQRSEVIQMIAQSTVLVFPSEWYEGFPLTIVEAFSVGTPVIARNLGVMKEIITHGHNGFLYETTEQLSHYIQTLLSESQTAERLSRNALSDYIKYYSPEQSIKELETIYYSVIESWRRNNQTGFNKKNSVKS